MLFTWLIQASGICVMSVQVWSNIGGLSAELGIVAIGVTVLMIAGEFDLSVGSVFGPVSGVAVLLMNAGLGSPLAIVASLLLAALIGTINGLLVTRLGIHSLVITLGGLMFYRAMLLVLTKGFPIPIEGSTDFFTIFTARPGGLTVVWYWYIGLTIVAQLLLVNTKAGNWQFAAGGNALAAKMIGVPVRRVKVRAFAITAVLAGLAGVVQLARFTSVDALRGDGLELEAVLAAVVGGTSLNGGVGSVFGTAMGVVMIAMMKQGLILMGIPGYYFRAAIGLLLIGAAVVNVLSTKSSE